MEAFLKECLDVLKKEHVVEHFQQDVAELEKLMEEIFIESDSDSEEEEEEATQRAYHQRSRHSKLAAKSEQFLELEKVTMEILNERKTRVATTLKPKEQDMSNVDDLQQKVAAVFEQFFR